MATVVLGRTGIEVNKNGFGALPIQRVSKEAAARLLRRAFDSGINYFDTARAYSDSEEKMGYALADVRSQIFIATKTGAATVKDFWAHLETSLSLLKTDYIDVYQLHNPAFCPKPGDESGLYDAMLEARQQGKIRFIGITNHRPGVAQEAVASGLYDTLQFPFSYLSSEGDEDLVRRCAQADVGFVAMKALSGGLITNSLAAYAFMSRYENVLPIWGVQREHELDEFLAYIKEPPTLTPEVEAVIARDKAQLTGEFCRGCGYCMPCPVGIQINMCARMSLFIRRSPPEGQLTEDAQNMMRNIENCLHCGQCVSRCPYGLNPTALIEKNYEDYKEILAGKSVKD